MATIYDVAKKAKVSPSTVSRIINGERNVAPATAAAVDKAIAEVGYVKRAVRPGPKPTTRAGVKTGIIDFLSLGAYSPAQMLSLPYFSKLLDGIMRGVEEQGMDLVLSHCPHGEVIPPVLARRQADGVILFGNPELFPKIAKTLERIPVVWCFLMESMKQPAANYVLYDNRPVGAMAAEYLVEKGHQQMAILNASPLHSSFIGRRDEFLRVLKLYGKSAEVIEGEFQDPPTGVAVRAQPLIERLAALNPRPTGVFCVSDDLMLAVFNGLRQRGIEPGRDIELIGCNNDQFLMEQMHPRPATIDLKLNRVGKQALELLLMKMSDSSDSKSTGTWVAPSFVPPEQGARL
ncbi:LacI family DNA-binding transcriptional regulator [Pontiellaceae bacterium B1224]|nr:LacI family DNA-binding transcriptional regulator [Pontiellaceae bacterium B1224]